MSRLLDPGGRGSAAAGAPALRSSAPESADLPPPRDPSVRSRSRAAQVLGLLALALGLGALAGVLWWAAVDLPGYRLSADGSAYTSERGLADFIAGDAWFTLLGSVVGLLIGWLGWRRLHLLGWPVVLVVTVSAFGAALMCWLVGFCLGPDNFNQRLTDARPGDLVLIQLTLRAKASLLVWPFAAALPVLLGSSLGSDHEEPRPRSHQQLHRAHGSGTPGGQVFGFSRRWRRREQP